jgi:3-oxoacyl-[acyl-carrier protein] reductase
MSGRAPIAPKDSSSPDTIVVTGASRGLGRYCADKLHEAGYRVIGFGRNEVTDRPYEMRTADVSDPDSVANAMRDIRRDPSTFALINAAGIASMNLVITTPPATVRRIVETNLLGTIYCCQQIAPALIRRGAGRIINFSTLGVPLAIKGEAIYIASKAGVEGFTRVFARELSPHGITVNSIAPGPIDTALIAKVPKDRVDAVVNQQIIQRQGTPEDVWKVVSMLLSDESTMVSGQTLYIGGA